MSFNIPAVTALTTVFIGPSFPEAEYKKTGKIPGHPDFHPNEYHGEDQHDHHHSWSFIYDSNTAINFVYFVSRIMVCSHNETILLDRLNQWV